MRPRLARAVLIGAVALHLLCAGSILSQPLDPHTPPQTARSVTWRLHYDSVTWPGPGADFFALYHAGVQVRRGESPFAADEQPRVTPYFFRYLYGPVLAHSLGAVVAGLPPGPAYRMWGLALEAALCAFVLVWRRQPMPEGARLTGTVVLLLSAPYFLELHMGQFTFAAASLALIGVSLAARRAPAAAGPVLLAAATLVKLFPVVGILALWRTRSMRTTAIGGAAVALVMVAGAWAYPRETAELARLNMLDDTTAPHPGHMGLLHLVRLMLAAAGLIAPAAPGWGYAGPIVLAVALGLTATIVIRRRMPPIEAFALLLFAFLLAFYRVAEHHFSAMLLTAVAVYPMVACSTLSRADKRLFAGLLIAVALPTPYALLDPDPATWSTAATVLVAASKSLPAAGLFGTALHANSRQPTCSST